MKVLQSYEACGTTRPKTRRRIPEQYRYEKLNSCIHSRHYMNSRVLLCDRVIAVYFVSHRNGGDLKPVSGQVLYEMG
jgi:hypothetical protein